MTRLKNMIALGAFALLVLGIPTVASAQYGQYDPYGRNGGYNSGSYGNMKATVKNLKSRTKDFQRQLDRDLDRSRINGTPREDQINDIAKQFRTAVNRLSESNNGNRDHNNVERALALGSQLDRAIGRSRISNESQNLWSGIRRDLQILGNAYGYNDRINNRNNRNRRGGGAGSANLPTWWPF